MNIGICIIAYNRLDSLRRVIASLKDSYYPHDVELIISVDKSDSTEVQMFAENVEWSFGIKRVVAHKQNLGLRKHILSCGELLDEFDALIVLEDDISVAPSFFFYAEQCVKKYFDNEQIAGISLYNFPLCYHNNLPFIPLHSDSDIYLQQTAQSWGQVWMRKQWKEFRKWYDLNADEFSFLSHLPKSICEWPKSSWLKYHSRYCIEQNKYFVYPYVSLSTNNGDAGTHMNRSVTLYQSPLLYGYKEDFKLQPIVSYDGFFENQLLYNYFSMSPSELCLDFYGEKGNREGKRYWLSRKVLPYKIMASYSLSLKPYELNVLTERKGYDLFLYDTSITEKNNNHENWYYSMIYLYNYIFGLRSFTRFYIKGLLDKFGV